MTEDPLGTSRVPTNTGVVGYAAAFYPYCGARTPYANNCPQNCKFTRGQEADAFI